MGSSTSTTTSGSQSGSSRTRLEGGIGQGLEIQPSTDQLLEEAHDLFSNIYGLGGDYMYQLQPFATSLLNGQGLGQGESYLNNMESLLGSSAQAYGAIGGAPMQIATSALAPLGLEALTASGTLASLAPYLGGDYLNNWQQNPFLQDLIQTTTNQTMNPIGAQFAAAGRDFSGAYANAAATGLGNALAPINYGYFNQQQANQLQAAGLANQLSGVWSDIAGQTGNVASNLANMYGSMAGGLGNVATAYGTMPQLYDQLALNRANMGAMGSQMLQLMTELPWAPYQNYANLLLPFTPFASTTTWDQQYKEKQNSSTSMFSDRRLKDDIQEVGKLNDGTPIYRYRFKGSKAYLIGLMADEVKTREAVSVGPSGFLMVDYEKATESSIKEEDE